MDFQKIVISNTEPDRKAKVWARPTKNGVDLFILDAGKWKPAMSEEIIREIMEDIGTATEVIKGETPEYYDMKYGKMYLDEVDNAIFVPINEPEGSIYKVLEFNEEGLFLNKKVGSVNQRTKLSPRIADLTQEERASLKGDKGDKGDPGDSAVYDPSSLDAPDFEMANTTGQSTTKAMTQKAVTDELRDVSSYEYIDIDISELTKIDAYISQNKWANVSYGVNKSKMLEITPGKVYKFGKTGHDWHAFFLTTNEYTIGQTPSYAGGLTTMPAWSASGAYVVAKAPEDAHYLYMRITVDADCEPDVVQEVISVKDKLSSLSDEIDGFVEMKLYNSTGWKDDGAMTQKAVTEELDNVREYNHTGIDISTLTVVDAFISQNKWRKTISSNNKCKMLEITPGKVYKLGKTGHDWHAFFLTTNSYTLEQTPSYAGEVTTMPSWMGNGSYMLVKAPSDAHYLYMRITLDGADCEPDVVQEVVLERDMVEELDNSNISESFLVAQAKYEGGSATVPLLGLVHYSDLHGDTKAADELLRFLKRYDKWIDAPIVTGDVVHFYAEGTDDSRYPQGWQWWRDCGLAEKSLFVLGNHDAATKNTTEYDTQDSGSAWDGKGQEWAYDKYIAPYAENLGVVRPTGYDDPESPYYKACFWHKDFTQQKVRMIGIDVMHRFDGTLDKDNGFAKLTNGVKHDSTEQEEWLIARLNECKTGSGSSAAGYSVIVCGHYPLDDFDETTNGANKSWDSTTGWICNNNIKGGRVFDYKTGEASNWHTCGNRKLVLDRIFNMRNRTGTSSSWSKGTVNNIGNIIQSFVDGGGNFVAYLCGHFHRDLLYYSEIYPDILCVSVTQTGWLRGGEVEYKGGNVNERMTANYIAIDAARHVLKIVRCGTKTNLYLQPIHCIAYDYTNKKILNEW